jgi:hypothetical protein
MPEVVLVMEYCARETNIRGMYRGVTCNCLSGRLPLHGFVPHREELHKLVLYQHPNMHGSVLHYN